MHREDLFIKHYNRIRECVINAIIEAAYTGLPHSVVLWSDGDIDIYCDATWGYYGYNNTLEGIRIYVANEPCEYFEDEFDGEEDFKAWARELVKDVINGIMGEVELNFLNEDVNMDDWS